MKRSSSNPRDLDRNLARDRDRAAVRRNPAAGWRACCRPRPALAVTGLAALAVSAPFKWPDSGGE
jgi:hypothetical protein